MARPIITTSWTPRTSPNTTYERGEIILVSFDRTDITFDSTEYTWDMISELKVRDIQTAYNTPRKTALLETEIWLYFTLENGELLQAEWGNKSNIINTIYT